MCESFDLSSPLACLSARFLQVCKRGDPTETSRVFEMLFLKESATLDEEKWRNTLLQTAIIEAVQRGNISLLNFLSEAGKIALNFNDNR